MVLKHLHRETKLVSRTEAPSGDRSLSTHNLSEGKGQCRRAGGDPANKPKYS